MLSNANGSRQPDSQGECFLKGKKLPSHLDVMNMGMSEVDLKHLLTGLKYQRKKQVFNQQRRKFK